MSRGYGWLVWFIATLFVIYSFSLNTAASVFADAIKTTLHASPWEVSVSAASFILGFACMQIPAGYLLDRYNARFVVSSGVLILALGNTFISFATSVTIFTLANFLQGVGASFAFVAAAVLTAQWFPAKLFPIIFGLTQMLSCTFAAVIHYAFMLILQTHPWNDIYIGLAIFGGILFLATLLLVKSPTAVKQTPSPSLFHALSLIFTNKQMILCCLGAATSFGVALAYASFWYMPIQNYYLVHPLESAVISGLIFVGIGLGTPFWGWFSNYEKSRSLVVHLTLCVGCMLLLLCIYMPHFQIETLIIVKSVSLAFGFFLGGSMLFYTLISEMATDETRGVAISVLNTSVFLLNTLMLFIPYLLVTSISHDFFTYLWIFPFFIIFSILINYFIKDTFVNNK